MTTINESEVLINELPFPVFTKSHLDLFLSKMVALGASDLFLLSNRPAYVSLHGNKVQITSRLLQSNEITNLVKVIAGIEGESLLGSLQPIDRAIEYISQETQKPERFRVNIVSNAFRGQRATTITLRHISSLPPHYKSLGIEDPIIETAKQSLQGLIIVAGATGSGKSTLIASTLREIIEGSDKHKNLITIESPIEYVYDQIVMNDSFVTQMEVGRHISSFAEGVRCTMRMAPDIINIGEVRDFETVTAAINAAITGHVVFTTTHANSSLETVQRLMSFYPTDLKSQAQFEIFAAIKLFIAQRLVPSTNGKRVAIRETLLMTDSHKNYILDSSNVNKAFSEVLHEYGTPIQKDVELKLHQGLISIDTYNKLALTYGFKK